ncbi:MAG TPA: amino acid racemase [Pyrinomonadaceae bacterium]|nr:amino acid racemase [Pyrinomonadaceae bacterium]
MATLGIIGGIGPESTIEYYRHITALYREARGDGNYPHLLINSINFERMVSFFTANQFQEAARYLIEEIERLARAGASFGLIAANTPHIVFDEVEAASGIPLISIVEETRQAAQALDLRRVGLFGTTFTVRGRLYEKVFDKAAIEVVSPSAGDQDFIHEKYMKELVSGVVREETRAKLLEIVSGLKAERKIEGLILGGTELSLILKDGDDAEIPFLDTTRIHAQSAVRELLKREAGGA